MSDKTHAIYETCFFCRFPFQFGPHRYDGEHFGHLKISVCKNCISAGRDGMNPSYGEALLAHAKAHGLPEPRKNARGFVLLE